MHCCACYTALHCHIMSAAWDRNLSMSQALCWQCWYIGTPHISCCSIPYVSHYDVPHSMSSADEARRAVAWDDVRSHNDGAYYHAWPYGVRCDGGKTSWVVWRSSDKQLGSSVMCDECSLVLAECRPLCWWGRWRAACPEQALPMDERRLTEDLMFRASYIVECNI